jgi:hypothetical protein
MKVTIEILRPIVKVPVCPGYISRGEMMPPFDPYEDRMAENPAGRLVEELLLQGGVDQYLSRWAVLDGARRKVRNGLNFITGRGYCARAGVGYPDHGNTAVLQSKRGDFNWESIFSAELGSRCSTREAFLPHDLIRCLPLHARAWAAERHASHHNALKQFEICNIQKEWS